MRTSATLLQLKPGSLQALDRKKFKVWLLCLASGQQPEAPSSDTVLPPDGLEMWPLCPAPCSACHTDVHSLQCLPTALGGKAVALALQAPLRPTPSFLVPGPLHMLCPPPDSPAPLEVDC